MVFIIVFKQQKCLNIILHDPIKTPSAGLLFALTAEGRPRRERERGLITARLQRGLQRTRQRTLISRKHATLSHRNKWVQTQVRTRMHSYTGTGECTPPGVELFKRRAEATLTANQLKNTNNILCYLFLYKANPPGGHCWEGLWKKWFLGLFPRLTQEIKGFENSFKNNICLHNKAWLNFHFGLHKLLKNVFAAEPGGVKPLGTKAGTEVLHLISVASVERATNNQLAKQLLLFFNDKALRGITDGLSIRALECCTVKYQLRQSHVEQDPVLQR